MESAGFSTKVKNFWLRGDPYNGINVKVKDPQTGRNFEVQFHTETSFAVKEETHKQLEVYRKLPMDDPQRGPLWDSMTELADTQRFPPGVLDIKPLLRQSPND
jgi:hypothetical protein